MTRNMEIFYIHLSYEERRMMDPREISTLMKKTLAGKALLFIGILLVASNLRASLTSVGPLVGTIRAENGLSGVMAGLLTTLPLIAFAVLSPLAPRLARRFGTESTLFASLAVLTAGILLRSLHSVAALFAGTVLLGLAIAVGNVLLPSIIKRDFSDRVGLMTGLYSAFMGTWAAIASGVSVPLARGVGLGWRGSLAFWAILSAIALLSWWPLLRSRRKTDRGEGESGSREPARSKSRLWRSPLAWQVTWFMGLQSLLFYVTIAWYPEILRDRGLSAAAAGWMLSLIQLVSLPANLLVPVLAGRLQDQRGLVAGITVLYLAGYGGLLSGGTALVLWTVLIGIAQGASISLALTFFALRARDARQSAELSGMAQSVGYLLAAGGPVLFGLLHDRTHAWTVPLFTLIGASLLFFASGLGAGRNRYVIHDRTGM
jgi:CP family cyanate transporter-like MFS transporter